MVFQPKTRTQILDDMVDYVRTRTDITDFNRGSVIRTILEAAALEDDEQYYQMVQIIRDFSYRTASGRGLLRRARDYSVYKNPATAAFGHVVFMDTNLERSYLSSNVNAGATSISVEDGTVYNVPAERLT